RRTYDESPVFAAALHHDAPGRKATLGRCGGGSCRRTASAQLTPSRPLPQRASVDRSRICPRGLVRGSCRVKARYRLAGRSACPCRLWSLSGALVAGDGTSVPLHPGWGSGFASPLDDSELRAHLCGRYAPHLPPSQSSRRHSIRAGISDDFVAVLGSEPPPC